MDGCFTHMMRFSKRCIQTDLSNFLFSASTMKHVTNLYNDVFFWIDAIAWCALDQNQATFVMVAGGPSDPEQRTLLSFLSFPTSWCVYQFTSALQSYWPFFGTDYFRPLAFWLIHFTNTFTHPFRLPSLLLLASAQLAPRAPPPPESQGFAPQDGEGVAPSDPNYTCHSVGECMACTDLERVSDPGVFCLACHYKG